MSHLLDESDEVHSSLLLFYLSLYKRSRPMSTVSLFYCVPNRTPSPAIYSSNISILGLNAHETMEVIELDGP